MLQTFDQQEPLSRSVLYARDGVRLHAMLTSAGYERRAGRDYDWHGLRRGSAEFALFQYTLSGGGQLTWEGRSYRPAAGTAMLLYFPHDNRYWFEPAKDVDHWRFFFVCLHGAEVMRAWKRAVHAAGPLWQLDENSSLLHTAAETCRAVMDNRIASAWQASAMAYALAMGAAEAATPDGRGSTSERPASIDRVIVYCREHFHETIHVDDLAAIAGYSRYHFTRLFTQHEGVSPAQYLHQLRLRRAARLLRDSDVSIKQLAGHCGFSDANYFAKAFRRTFGVSPKAFRRSGMY